jgi:hypothetical protein
MEIARKNKPVTARDGAKRAARRWLAAADNNTGAGLPGSPTTLGVLAEGQGMSFEFKWRHYRIFRSSLPVFIQSNQSVCDFMFQLDQF